MIPSTDTSRPNCREVSANSLSVILIIGRQMRTGFRVCGSLRDAGIDFTAVDMPNANRMTVGVMALVAEQERVRRRLR